MDKIDLKELFNKKQEDMLLHFGVSSKLTHPVDKGDATEEEWRMWFKTFFPQRYKVDSAHIVDCEGNCSEQIDIVIYDTHFSPIIFELNGKKYIPAESVYAVFEVKQDLTKTHIKYAQRKIESVKKLKRTCTSINTIQGISAGRKNEILGGLLTYKCNWVKANIEKNIAKIIYETNENKFQQIDFICCLSEYACAIEYKSQIMNHQGENKYKLTNLNLTTDIDSAPLIFTYLKLLRMLQELGNVPAIDYSMYGISGI